MQLKKYADQITSHYSGGTKRKLSAAIALIGDPHVIMMVNKAKISTTCRLRTKFQKVKIVWLYTG